MKFTVDKHDRYVVIEPLSDTLNGQAAAKLKGEFMLRNTSGQRNIVLDLRHVEKADEDGLRVGLLARRLCKAAGGYFILTGLHKEVRDLIALSNLEGYFKIVDSLTEAETLIFGNELRLDLKSDR